MVWNHEIQSLFQMEKQSGISGIATLKPTSVDDLAILNSTIRLMAQERGGEMPTEKLARFKMHPEMWLQEMEKYGLSEHEQDILRPVLGMSYGLCIAQEQFMELVQLPELGGFNLSEEQYNIHQKLIENGNAKYKNEETYQYKRIEKVQEQIKEDEDTFDEIKKLAKSSAVKLISKIHELLRKCTLLAE